jgi:presenilin-like A22 family membrane protease
MTTLISENKREITAILLMGLFFVIIHGTALLLLQPFETAGVQPAFEDPENPTNIIYIFVIMLAFTALILLIAKFWKKQVIHFIILFAIGYTMFYAFFLPLYALLLPLAAIGLLILSAISALIVVLLLYKFPEWYIIDLTGVLVGTSAIIIFGMSLSVFLVILLLIGLAVYDAISVYKTKHMVDLADTVMDLKLPVLLVVPKIREYSLIKETRRLKEQIKDKEERDAFFMGLGDIVMPGILVVSVYYSLPSAVWVSIGTMIGTLIGFAFLMRYVLRGNPQAGLPLLCGGAIIGYVISSLILFGELVGLSLPF